MHFQKKALSRSVLGGSNRKYLSFEGSLEGSIDHFQWSREERLKSG
jgi:hypothetical protein